MSSGPVTQAFYEWLRKHDEEQAQSECPRSYYDADTGLTDYEQARADELSEAFEGGVAYERSVERPEKITRVKNDNKSKPSVQAET